MVGQRTLYEEVTKVAEDYFGPAAPRIMSRVISNHLRKEPQTISHKDMAELIKWIRLALSVITEDKVVITEFTSRLRELSH